MDGFNRERYNKAFVQFDTDKDGQINEAELRAALSSLNKDTSDAEVKRAFQKGDENKDGTLSLGEFLLIMERADTAWIRVQTKTFTRWANNVLSQRLLKIESITMDLRDGVALVPLLELLSGKKLSKFNPKPRMRVHRTENINIGLKFLASDGVSLINIGAEDIEDGNEKITLGLVWAMILNYTIGSDVAEGTPKWDLLQWVKKQIKPYGMGDELTGFKSGWSDGRVLSALTDSLGPGAVDMKELDEDPYRCCGNAMNIAEEKFLIPKVMDASDLVDTPDEHSTMTYVSYFRDYEKNNLERKRQQEEQERLRKLRTATAEQSFAHGPGLEPGCFINEPLTFTIEARNEFGNGLEPAHGGDDFKVVVEGPEPVTVTKEDKDTGSYPCSYQVSTPGTYSVTITLDGKPIKDGERKFLIDGPAAGKCTASGPGVEGGPIDSSAAFTITTFNGDGKQVKHGGDPYVVKVTDPAGVTSDVATVDNKDGTYKGSYDTKAPGVYKVDVTLRGEPIANSPFLALQERGNGPNSWAEGEGLSKGKTARQLQFVIHSVGADGKPAATGGDPFKVGIQGPNGDVAAQVTDNKDGTYNVIYAPDVPGTYNIKVSLHDKDIKDSPFAATVKQAPNAAKSTVSGPGLTVAYDNHPAQFTVHAKDDLGNPVSGDDCVVTVVPTGDNKTAAPVDVKVVDNKDGTYSVTYAAPSKGKYTIDAQLDGKSVQGVPLGIVVREGADAQNVDAGTFKFTIRARNKEGGMKTEGGDAFDVKILGPADFEVHVKTEDHGDGSYSATYVLAAPRADAADKGPQEFRVSVRLNEEHINGSPFKQYM